jgi:hypothetical protein
MRTLHLLAVTQLFAIALSMPGEVQAQTIVPIAPFHSVELSGGGRVVLRNGPVQRVTLVKGSPDHTRITIADGGWLVIKNCEFRCPRGYELEIEIVTPDIARISVGDGGSIQSRGSFPRQAEIKASVRDGGMIDIRSMAVDSVYASVEEGGMIFTMPQANLVASVVNGGNITYWGDPRIKWAVKSGGVVVKGTAEDADKAASEFSSPLTPPAPIPAIRPIQPIRN